MWTRAYCLSFKDGSYITTYCRIDASSSINMTVVYNRLTNIK